MEPSQVTREQWISLALLAPYLIFFVVRALHYLALTMSGRQRPFDQEMADKGTTALLGFHIRQVFVWSA